MEWRVVFHMTDDGQVPGEEFLDSCPGNVEANFVAVLEVVRTSPPPRFSGGGKWEAMHGSMSGYYEVRGTGPGRMHYRLFCLLDNGTPEQLAERGLDRPAIRRDRRHGEAQRDDFLRGRLPETRALAWRRLPEPPPAPDCAVIS